MNGSYNDIHTYLRFGIEKFTHVFHVNEGLLNQSETELLIFFCLKHEQVVFSIIAPFKFFSDTQRCTRCQCEMCNKHMYGLSVCKKNNHSLKLVAYRLVHTDEQYINLHKDNIEK